MGSSPSENCIKLALHLESAVKWWERDEGWWDRDKLKTQFFFCYRNDKHFAREVVLISVLHQKLFNRFVVTMQEKNVLCNLRCSIYRSLMFMLFQVVREMRQNLSQRSTTKLKLIVCKWLDWKSNPTKHFRLQYSLRDTERFDTGFVVLCNDLMTCKVFDVVSFWETNYIEFQKGLTQNNSWILLRVRLEDQCYRFWPPTIDQWNYKRRYCAKSSSLRDFHDFLSR